MNAYRISELLTKEFFHTPAIVGSTRFISQKDGEIYSTHITFPDGSERNYLGKGSTQKFNDWMNMLGFTTDGCPSLYSSILMDFKKSALQLQNSFYSVDAIFDCANEFLSIYSAKIKTCPFIQVYFKHVYEILYNCYSIELIEESGFNLLSIDSACKQLCSDIDYILSNILIWQNYVEQALIKPYNAGYVRKTALYFHSYDLELAYLHKANPCVDAAYMNSRCHSSSDPYTPDKKGQALGSFFISDSGHFDYVEENSKEYSIYLESNDISLSDDYLFTGQFLAGISFLIETDSIIKQCPCCQRFFLCKYSTKATYCSNRYKNNMTCQEYMAHMNFQKKKAENSFYNAYYKIYNKIYSRLRRGSITKEEAKLDELARLKKIYFEKHKSAPSSDLAESVIQDFILEAERLYNEST